MLSFQKLAEFAKDKSASGRRSLVNALTDMFLSADDEHVEQVSLMFGDIVMAVLGQLEDEARAALSARIGSHGAAPSALMVELARDGIEIARPVLENSPVLGSDDLVDIARGGSMDHLDAIAGRPAIDEAVTEILVDRGNDTVLTKVAGNEGARFASESFHRLVEKAKGSVEIQSALVRRTDLPTEIAEVLVPILSEELCQRIGELGANDALLSVMAGRAAEEVMARSQGLEGNRVQAEEIITEVQSGKMDVDEAVRLFARSNRSAELGILLARMSKLPVSAVSKLVYSDSDKALIILCKANGVTGPAFNDILALRAKRLKLDGTDLKAAVSRFGALSVEGAVRSLQAIRESATHKETQAAV